MFVPRECIERLVELVGQVGDIKQLDVFGIVRIESIQTVEESGKIAERPCYAAKD